jgi:hypothetical protein
MSVTRRSAALALVLAVVLMAAVEASPASASYEFRSGGAPFTGHFIIGQSSATQIWKTSTGSSLTCNTVTGEGLIEAKGVGEVEGHVGRIGSLVFGDMTHLPNTECQSTVATFTECAYVFKNTPYELRAVGTTAHIVSAGVGNPSFTQTCESGGGSTLTCTYAVAKISGAWGGGTHKVSINQQFPLTAGGFLCPSSGTWVGTLGFRTEAGAEVILTNV